MIRNLLDLAAVLLDALVERLTRRALAEVEWTVPETWRPDHIHLAADGACTYGGCELEGFHFHEDGAVYRTLREYEATRR